MSRSVFHNCIPKRGDSVGVTDSSLKMGMSDRQLQEKLSEAFKTRQLSLFTELLFEDVDLNHKYPPKMTTLLMQTCQDDTAVEFLKTLLNKGADPNATDQDHMTAIHHATSHNNLPALQILLNDKRTDVNALDLNGWNALHYTTDPSWEIGNKIDHLKCIALLMDHPKMEVNRPDIFGQTPIVLALVRHFNERIKIMLIHGYEKLDIDWSRTFYGKDIRDIIKTKFPELVPLLPQLKMENLNAGEPNIKLMAALQRQNFDIFSDILENDGIDPNFWYEDPYYCTCLELACRFKTCHRFVTALLAAGANPNTVNKIDGMPLIHRVIEAGNHQLLQLLLGTGVVKLNVFNNYKHTPFHIVAQTQYDGDIEDTNAHQCLSLLLNSEISEQKSPSTNLDINAQDNLGVTALHEAAYFGNKQTVLTLLREGASIMKKNKYGELPLEYIDAKTLETFFNEQLDSNGIAPQSEEFELIMQYDSLIPQSCQGETFFTEMDLLKHISKSESLRRLLKHPLISAFLYLKWHRVRWAFLINLIFYIWFVIFLTIYSILINVEDPKLMTFKNNTNNSRENLITMVENDQTVFICICLTRVMLVILLICLSVREFLEVLKHPRMYFTTVENILEITLFVLTFVLLFSPFLCRRVRQHLTAVAIILAWTELILMSGRLPYFSLQLEMFKKVCFTFIRFMAWYSLVLLAFAISFYILFKDSAPFYSNLGLSILKTVVMLAGEFEASNLDFKSVPITSHLLFCLFVVLISIILLNLLNGLAVYDTQAIKDDAEILSLVSMVRIISYIEDIAVSIFKNGKFENYVQSKIQVFDPNIETKQIHVDVSHGEIKFLSDGDTSKKFEGYKMEDYILRIATDIIMNRNEVSQFQDIKQSLALYQTRLDNMEVILNRIQDVLEKL